MNKYEFDSRLQQYSNGKYKRLPIMLNGDYITYRTSKAILKNNKIFIGENHYIELDYLYDMIKDTHIIESYVQNGIEEFNIIKELLALNITTWDYNIMCKLLDNKNIGNVYTVPDSEFVIEHTKNLPEDIQGDLNNFKSNLLITNIVHNSRFNTRAKSKESQMHVRFNNFSDYVRIMMSFSGIPNPLMDKQMLEILEQTPIAEDWYIVQNCNKYGVFIDSVNSLSIYTTKRAINETLKVNLDGCDYKAVTQLTLGYLADQIVTYSGQKNRDVFYKLLRNYIPQTKMNIADRLLDMNIEDII